MINHKNSRKNRIDVFQFGKDGSVTRYHFHLKKGNERHECSAMRRRIVEDMRKDGGRAVLVNRKYTVAQYFIEGSMAWQAIETENIKEKIAEIRALVTEKAKPAVGERSEEILTCETCDHRDSCARKPFPHQCHSSLRKEPEHKAGERCTFPVIRMDLEKSRGLEFFYKREAAYQNESVPLGTWLADFDNIVRADSADFTINARAWILRAVPKWEPQEGERVWWSGVTAISETDKPQTVTFIRKETDNYWSDQGFMDTAKIIDAGGCPRSVPIHSLSPLSQPAKWQPQEGDEVWWNGIRWDGAQTGEAGKVKLLKERPEKDGFVDIWLERGYAYCVSPKALFPLLQSAAIEEQLKAAEHARDKATEEVYRLRAERDKKAKL